MDNDKLEQKVYEIEARLGIVEKDTRRNDEQHKEIFIKLEKLVIESNTVITQFQTILGMITDVKSDIKNIQSDMASQKEKPAKRWESIVMTVITTIVGAVVGGLAVKWGLK